MRPGFLASPSTECDENGNIILEPKQPPLKFKFYDKANQPQHTRAELIRKLSASLLRQDATPTLVRQTSGLSLFPERDNIHVGDSITLFYVSEWEQTRLHYKSDKEDWSIVPGRSMTKTPIPTQKLIRPLLDALDISPASTLWMMELFDVTSIEFVPNNRGVEWDHAPGGGNYFLGSPGRYILKDGRLTEWLFPPEKPAVVRAEMIGSSKVTVAWNAPVARLQDIVGYHVYRDERLIAVVGEAVLCYEDTQLIGTTRYTYRIYGVNRNGVLGAPSDELEVTTGDPERPGPVEWLRVSDYSRQRIQLSWQQPMCFGGGPIDCYQVYRDGVPVGFVPATLVDWQIWNDLHVEDNTTYIYHVTACRRIPPFQQRQRSLTKLPSLSTQRLNELNPPVLPAKKTQEALDAYLQRITEMNDYEGHVSPGVVGVSKVKVPVPTLLDDIPHIMLQVFNWHSCHEKDWYSKVHDKLDMLKAARVTMAWLPPPSKSVSPEGYMPTKWYTVDSAYGTKDMLIKLQEDMKSHGVMPMLDLVVNHRCGVLQDVNGDWTIFEDPDWGAWAVVQNNAVGYSGLGAVDTGATTDCAPDLDHTCLKVRRDIKKWMSWLFDDIGYGAIRIDMAPGYAPQYQAEYVDHVQCPFAVGEYWSGDPHALFNYTRACRGLVAAYDFALYYVLRRCIESGDYSELSAHGRVPGLTGMDPRRSVTFIENHDTCHLTFVGSFAGGNKEAVLRAMAYILTHPGTPCLYWDYFIDPDMHDTIAALGRLRHEAKLLSTCSVYIDAARNGLYAAYIGKSTFPSNGWIVAMKLGDAYWEPNGDNWQPVVCHPSFSVWKRTQL